MTSTNTNTSGKKPNKPDHPWKKAFSVKRAAEDRNEKRQVAQQKFQSNSK